jgi:hypothetical protein
MNERHLDHAAEILGCLFEPREDATRLFKPANEALNDVSSAIRVVIKLDGTGIAVFAFPGGNDRTNPQLQQVFVNPVGSISLVARQGNRPCDTFAFAIKNPRIGLFQQRIQDSRFMRLPGREMEV